MTLPAALYFLALIGGVVLSFLRWRKLRHGFRFLALALIFTLVSESYLKLLYHFKWDLPRSYALFTPLFFGALIAVYLRILPKFWPRLLAGIGLAAVLLKGGLELGKFEMDFFPLTSVSFDILVLVFIVLLGFRHMLQYPNEESLLRNPFFLMSAAHVVYWSFSYVRIGSMPAYLELVSANNRWFESLHTWLSVVYYALLAYVLYLASLKRTHD